MPHLMTSGFNGSPTLSTCRSEVRSYFATISSPAPISIRKAVGALYQTLTPSRSIVPYQLSGLKRPPTMTFVAPFSHGAKCRIPYLSPSPDQLCTSKCLLPVNQGPTFLSDIAESSLHGHEAHPWRSGRARCIVKQIAVFLSIHSISSLVLSSFAASS